MGEFSNYASSSTFLRCREKCGVRRGKKFPYWTRRNLRVVTGPVRGEIGQPTRLVFCTPRPCNSCHLRKPQARSPHPGPARSAPQDHILNLFEYPGAYGSHNGRSGKARRPSPAQSSKSYHAIPGRTAVQASKGIPSGIPSTSPISSRIKIRCGRPTSEATSGQGTPQDRREMEIVWPLNRIHHRSRLDSLEKKRW